MFKKVSKKFQKSFKNVFKKVSKKVEKSFLKVAAAARPALYVFVIWKGSKRLGF